MSMPVGSSAICRANAETAHPPHAETIAHPHHAHPNTLTRPIPE
jgi:hypothetical protein